MLDMVFALMVGGCGIGSGDGNDGHGVGVVVMDVVRGSFRSYEVKVLRRW